MESCHLFPKYTALNTDLTNIDFFPIIQCEKPSLAQPLGGTLQCESLKLACSCHYLFAGDLPIAARIS